MHLGVFAVGTGNHIAGWRHPGAFKSASDLSAFVQMAQTAERGKMEGMLGHALANVFAVAEAYPELKANENFINLHQELSSLEDEIQMSRRYYNGTVRNLNVLIESFPSNIIAGSFNFVQAEFFEIEDEGDRAVPEVSFS